MQARVRSCVEGAHGPKWSWKDYAAKHHASASSRTGTRKITLHLSEDHVVSRQVQGEVLTNGSPESSLRAWKSVCCYIPQDDILLNSLTPREHLRYAARLKLPYKLPLAVKYQRVEEVSQKVMQQTMGDTRAPTGA
jgi:ABC-type multidrug transport system ATPase subunit